MRPPLPPEGRVVAHLLEGYAATGENYVFEQVNFASRYRGVMLAEWRLRHGYDPVTPASRREVFRSTWKASLAERAVRYLARGPLEGWYLDAFTAFLTRGIKRHQACLVHAHFGMMGYKALQAAQALGLPLVVTFYGVDGSQAVRDPYWRPRLARMLAAADKVIVLCDEVAERLVRLGCEPTRLLVWDIGIPLEEYPYRPPRTIAAGEPVRFLTVARFVEKKGYRYLLEAFHRLLAAKHVDARLTIAGNGPLKAEIEQWIAAFALADRVTVIDTTGMLDFFDLFKRLLREHDLFVLPSVIAKSGDDEGGPPVVIANAQATGLPVISTPVGGITRAITDGETGVLVEPENAESLSAAMCALARDADKRAHIAAQARQHIERHFDARRQLERVVAVYDQVLESAA